MLSKLRQSKLEEGKVNFSFRPNINRRSRKIAEKMIPRLDSLYLKKIIVQETMIKNQPSFKPLISKVSLDIAKRMR